MWVPRVPLVEVERHVDFQVHHDHVTDRRANVERMAARRAKRLVYATAMTGMPPLPQVQALATTFETALYRTAVFGFRQTRRELASLRSQPVRAGLVIHDAGGYGRAARDGLTQVRLLLRHRAQLAASAVSAAATQAARQARTENSTDIGVRAAVAKAVTRTLHNHVIELVGETLNLGRASGALTLPNPPEYALRSEQLDKATCEPCDHLHGEIVVVDSSEYYDLMPPNGCLGGGRCRGIYVYGDTTGQMALDEAA